MCLIIGVEMGSLSLIPKALYYDVFLSRYTYKPRYIVRSPDTLDEIVLRVCPQVHMNHKSLSQPYRTYPVELSVVIFAFH